MPDAIEKLVESGKLDSVGKILDEGPTPPGKAFVQPVEDGAPTPSATGTQLEALAKLRQEVPPNYISSLPKQTKRQKEELEKNRALGIRCALCHGWHHKDALHVPYVGHAAVTDKLLAVDPFWSWEPVAWTSEGLPRFDASGGMWIRLTIAGVTRFGYGHGAQKNGQDPGAREKEVIGDALRNAAMRFGVALELWHKGELHPDGEGATDEVEREDDLGIDGAPEGTFITDEQRVRILQLADAAGVEGRAICERYGIDALPQLHADAFDELMGSLKITFDKKIKEKSAGFGAETPSKQKSEVLDDDVPF